MASGLFYQSHYAKEINIVDIFAKVAIGATGAPTLDVAGSKGVTSVTRNATGDYTFLLADRYPSLLSVQAQIMDAADVDLTWQIISEAVDSTAPTVKIGWHAAATPTDPSSGTTMFVRITLKNSSV